MLILGITTAGVLSIAKHQLSESYTRTIAIAIMAEVSQVESNLLKVTLSHLRINLDEAHRHC